jgi:acetyltransferase
MLRRVAASGRSVLTEEESKRFITTYGFPVIPQIPTNSLDEALAAAKKIGYPVVLKIISHDITHKSAAGGVEVGVCSPPDLESAYERMTKRVAKSSPKAAPRIST